MAGRSARRKPRTRRRGIPQGSPISPLLANLYMRRFVLGWKQRGLSIDFGQPDRDLRGRPRHLLPPGRCRRRRCPDAGADGEAGSWRSTRTRRGCVGYRTRCSTFWATPLVGCTRRRTGKARMWAIVHRGRSIRRVVRAGPRVDRALQSRFARDTGRDGVSELNRLLRGWSNYFSVGTDQPGVSSGRSVTPTSRLSRWLRKKHRERRRRGYGQLSSFVPLPDARSGPSHGAQARRVVGVGVMSCPRAGCGSSARPVR